MLQRKESFALKDMHVWEERRLHLVGKLPQSVWDRGGGDAVCNPIRKNIISIR